jgi:hypothetical protein
MHDKGFFGFRHFPTSDLARATIGSSDSAQPERCFAALSNPSRYPGVGLNGRNDDHGPKFYHGFVIDERVDIKGRPDIETAARQADFLLPRR